MLFRSMNRLYPQFGVSHVDFFFQVLKKSLGQSRHILVVSCEM